MKFLKKLLKRPPQVVEITGDDEQRMMTEMARIEGIDKWLELHRIAGYQLFGNQKDEKFLGYVNFAESLQVRIENVRQPKEEEEEETGGYESTV